MTTVQGSPKGLLHGATILKFVMLQGQTDAKGTANLLQTGHPVPAESQVTVSGMKQQMVATQNIDGKQISVIYPAR